MVDECGGTTFPCLPDEVFGLPPGPINKVPPYET
tara:strand:- start:1242 stop:1343 length:102 start_codon:yes stop_codon:yes gene_type:complete